MKDKEIEKAKNEFISMGVARSDDEVEWLVKALQEAEARGVARERERGDEILEALEDMYGQYCSEGHAFMSAGERASSIIEKYGTLKLGKAGEILEYDSPQTRQGMKQNITLILVLVLLWAHFAPEIREWYGWHFVSAVSHTCLSFDEDQPTYRLGTPKSSFDFVSLTLKHYTLCHKTYE